MSDHNVKLVGNCKNLVGQCLMTDCYFQHWHYWLSFKDRSIAVWDMQSPTDISLRRVLVGHRAAVNVVDFDDKYIVSASGDRTIKVSLKCCSCSCSVSWDGAVMRALTSHQCGSGSIPPGVIHGLSLLLVLALLRGYSGFPPPLENQCFQIPIWPR